jgi:hypothetical protein
MSGTDFHGEQELSELARVLAVPAARDLPAGRQQILQEHLMTEVQRTEPKKRALTADHRRKRPSRMAAVAGAGVLAAAVAATAIVAGHAWSGHSSQSLPPGQPGGAGTPTAAVLLARIADAAASQPAPVVRNSEFMYIRSEEAATPGMTVKGGHATSTMGKLHERQVWLPVANICVTGLLTEDGSSTPLSPFSVVNGKVQYPVNGQSAQSGGSVSNITCPSEGQLGYATYRLLQTLPTRPAALLNYLDGGKGWTNDDPATEIGDLIREAIIPPAVAAALYRVAALLPGAVVVPDAVNAVGQHGIGLSWAGTGAGQDDRMEWIFDKTTLQYIGERDYNVKTGVVSGESAILQRAFVDKAGQLP